MDPDLRCITFMDRAETDEPPHLLTGLDELFNCHHAISVSVHFLLERERKTEVENVDTSVGTSFRRNSVIV